MNRTGLIAYIKGMSKAIEGVDDINPECVVALMDDIVVAVKDLEPDPTEYTKRLEEGYE